ncbi:efflux RND transporter periplasmic adaptor subunit [Pseudoalteromonas luteoviolacea]|uniref:efflux RND transporter periplasmic adaptor subunit n=1 Tax=Pseudoalteromonas luteoviolacea TaxID=43657 RepID=UPI001B35A732|nr:efflux RND transporter periplasmic adaptor subunit [Pseudoalteromonas luteoviolacea]MBQ4809833.1 efflux RND transporter periplasmic adaptor subunit [Pseudoalteromonas luteoviolacea]
MKIKAWIATVVAIAALIGFMGYIKWIEMSAIMAASANVPEYSETVEATQVKQAKYTQSVAVIGNAVAPDHIELLSEASGLVSEVNFSSGERVKGGEVIVQLDIRTEQANLKAASAKRKLLASNYTRVKALSSHQAISQEALDTAQANLVVIDAEIEAIKNIIRKKTITAPFDGVLGIHSAKAGEFLSANTRVVSITGEAGFMWVDFYIPQIYRKLAVGSLVQINKVGETAGLMEAKAGIVAVEESFLAGIRSRKYRAKVLRTSLEIDVNEAIAVSVPVKQFDDIMSVPNISVLRDVTGGYVFELIPTGSKGQFRAKRKPVEIISSNEHVTFLHAGVTPDSIVAAPGAFKLFDGVLVNVVNQTHTLANKSATFSKEL